jgi:hypothetical protein
MPYYGFALRLAAIRSRIAKRVEHWSALFALHAHPVRMAMNRIRPCMAATQPCPRVGSGPRRPPLGRQQTCKYG